jgi:hypothetical protein
MIRNRPLLILLAVATLGASALAATPVPTLPIDQALKIAQDYLQQRGATGQIQIIGLVVEQASPSVYYWYAKWSGSISTGDKKENGLRIDMDGTITRFVNSPDNPSGADWVGEKPQGQRKMGARNIHGGAG